MMVDLEQLGKKMNGQSVGVRKIVSKENLMLTRFPVARRLKEAKIQSRATHGVLVHYLRTRYLR
jgi:hypothetical protein